MRTGLAFWLICGCGFALIGSPVVLAEGRASVKLELKVTPDTLLLGGRISVEIRLTNTGAQPVDAPKLKNVQNTQPVYRLVGPSYPDGVTFSLRDVKLAGNPDALRADDAPSTYHLAAGETMETGFALDDLKPIKEPGEYTISARVEGKGWSAESAPLRFRVEKAKFLEGSLGVDVAAPSTRSLRAVWIADSAGERVLGESFLYEKRPDLGEVKSTGTRIIRSIGPAAFNAFCPWVNFDRTEANKFWHGWQEGNALFAFSEDESQPRVFDLGSKKVQVVRPTIMSHSGELDVLALGADRKTLQMIRFPAEESKGQAAVAWTIELPQEAVAISLGIGSQAEGGSRVVAAVSQMGSQMAIRLIRIGDNSATVGVSAKIDQAFALPSSEPSVSIAPDGTVRASILFARKPLDRALAVFDLTSRRNGETNLAVSDVGMVPTPVRKAWTAQTVTSEGQAARRWLALSANDLNGGGDHPIPVKTAFPVVDFLRMSAATYVLGLDPDRGPHLLATDF
jgi:hypothetical protein